MERAIAFYRDLLGLTMVRRDGASWAVFDVDGRTLALHGNVDGRPFEPGGAAAVFGVDDLDVAVALLGQLGVRFDHQGDVGGYARFVAFRDPDGNTLQLIEYAEGAGPAGEGRSV
jgi:catechol 2,3-dioxygenase-like lactoylglutathione lyase family enzyme